MALTIGAAIATETMKCRKKAEKVCFDMGFSRLFQAAQVAAAPGGITLWGGKTRGCDPGYLSRTIFVG